VKNYALVVVDLIKDNVDLTGDKPLDREAAKILPTIRSLTKQFRRNGGRVIFACDSFMEGDFIFKSRIPPHAIRGTHGDMPLDELEMQAGDLYLPKRRMSAFYKTDLDQTLRTWGIDTVAVCGIVTNVCVLLTAFDAVQNDFHAILVSDACACHSRDLHESTLRNYEKMLLTPIFRVMTSAQLIDVMANGS